MYKTKQHTAEGEFIKKEEMLRLKKKALEMQELQEEAEKKELKELHYMHCPKCGQKLEELKFNGVMIDKCFSCKGLFLDAGELEKLLETDTESSFVKDLFSFFK